MGDRFSSFQLLERILGLVNCNKIRRPLARPSSIKTNQQHESKSYRFLNLKSSLLLFLYRFTTAFEATTPNTRMSRKSIIIDNSIALSVLSLLVVCFPLS